MTDKDDPCKKPDSTQPSSSKSKASSSKSLGALNNLLKPFAGIINVILSKFGGKKVPPGGMGDAAKQVVGGRTMKFPYTYTAKIVQFPWKFIFKNVWITRYLIYASILWAPLFYKIQKASYHPENVRKWNEIRRKAFTPGPHHDHH